MQRIKLFPGLLSLLIIAITIVSCDSKGVETMNNLYKIAADNEGENESESENENESENESLNSEIQNNVTSNVDGNANKIDVILNEYEKFSIQYKDYKNRISEGDITLLAEAPEILDKVQELKTKLEESKSEMTAEQMLRLSQILSNS